MNEFFEGMRMLNESLRTAIQSGTITMLFLSLMPALISIILAFKFKNVFLSLGCGLYTGLVIDAFLKGTGLILAFIVGIFNLPVYITNSLGNNPGIVIQILLISGLIYLLTYTGGLKKFADSIIKYANTRERTQFITWLMGIAIFFDDYANALIVGPVMRNITDKSKISREKLAFIIDATAAPIAGIVIISTWIGYEISLIQTQLTLLETQGLEHVPAMGVFINSIPFRFYNILMLIFIVMTIYTRREYGPMYKAEMRALNGETTNPEDNEPDEEKALEEELKVKIKEGYEAKAYEGIIPIIILIISAFYFFISSGLITAFQDPDISLKTFDSFQNALYNIGIAFSNADTGVALSQAALLAIISTFIISGSRGAFKLSEGIDITLDGAAKLIPTAFVLLLAWSLGTVMDAEHLNTGNYLASVLGNSLPYQIVPVTIFLLASLMAFSTGTSYGTMGILFPLAIPLAFATNPDINFIILVISAILTGTILGDHCSPISDTTLLSSAGAEVNHIAHVDTQMPYALTVGGISCIGYLICGFIIGTNLNIYIVLPVLYILLISSMYIILKTFGKKIEFKN